MDRWREWKNDRPVIHAASPGGNDLTLCGAALEGVNGDEPMAETTQGKIDCEDCIAIIRHCKAISVRQLAA